MARNWWTIIALWGLGILAAAQLAKFSTLAPVLQARFGLSLTGLGLLISLLEVGGGLLGFAAGLGLGRIGCRLSLLLGLAGMGLASVVQALAPGAAVLFAARAVEGLGYLLVVIAAPTAIAAIATHDQRPRALALWSTFVPVGVAAGGAITSLAFAPLGAKGVMLLWAGVLALAWAGAAWAPGLRHLVAARGGRAIVLPDPAAWVATFAFGLYTLFVCALTMLLPTFLTSQLHAGLSQAGLVAALASLSTLPASVVVIAGLRRGDLSARRMGQVAVPALVGTAGLVLALFAPGLGLGLAVSGALAVSAVGVSGLVSPMMFARLPVLAGTRGPHDPRIATANGLLTQFGAGGALIGPPLGGWVVGRWGWGGLGMACAVLALAMLVALLLAEAVKRRA